MKFYDNIGGGGGGGGGGCLNGKHLMTGMVELTITVMCVVCFDDSLFRIWIYPASFKRHCLP